MDKRQWISLLTSLALCFLAAMIGAYATYPSIGTWYATLHKPFFNPPNYVFGPVWTVLYTLMGISLHVVWMKGTKKKKNTTALLYFFIQLSANTLWSLVFFYLHAPFLAFLVILFMWLMIFLTIQEFHKFSKIAAQMLYPYLAWVSFATLLNFAIVILN